MRPPLITIAIPTYNGHRHLTATLASAAAQTYPNTELLLLDDGSSDSSLALAHSFAAAHPKANLQIHSQPNAGIAAARNRLFSLGSPDAACFLYLDHDDLLAPDAISILSAALAARPDCPAAHAQTALIDDAGQPILPDPALAKRLNLTRRRLRGTTLLDSLRPAVPTPDHEDTTFATLIYSNCITSMGAILFRRDALAKLDDPFRPEYVPVDDWDLYLRLTLQGSLAYIPRPLLHWRLHQTNTSSAAAPMQSAYRRLLHHLATTPLPQPYKAQQKAAARYRAAARLLKQLKLTTKANHSSKDNI